MSLNRRVFLSGVGASAAYAMSRGVYAQSSGGPDPNLVNAASSSSASTAGNCWNGVFSGDDWRNITGTHALIRQDVNNKGLDGPFISAAQSMGYIDPSVIDTTSILSGIQTYQPAFQMSDLQAYLNTIPQDQDSLQATLANLRQGGLTGHLSNVISMSMKMAGYADAAAEGSGPGGMVKQKLNPMFQPPNPPPGYNCQVDGALSFAVASAFLIIGVMAAPEVAVLALAFWGPLSLWGGTAAGVWIAGHVVHCGF